MYIYVQNVAIYMLYIYIFIYITIFVYICIDRLIDR